MDRERLLLLEKVMGQTRLAVLEDGALCEIYTSEGGDDAVSGDIYLGRVQHVVSGLNAAFVDIGTGKNGFLDARELPRADHNGPGTDPIDRLVRPGQQLAVQVVKAAVGDKGPRLSANLSLCGRLVAIMPFSPGTGVSKKISDAVERERLRGILQKIASDDTGIIARTAAMGADASAIRAEYDALTARWTEIARRCAHEQNPGLLYSDEDAVRRALRGHIGAHARIIADGKALCDEISAYVADACGDSGIGIELHSGQIPLFDLYRVDEQIDRALERRVWLKSGASLVIDETEAMTVIDVNSTKHIARGDSEDMLYEVNCEAADEIMRQLRLRNLGGIVVVDFIDMGLAEHKKALMNRLEALAAGDDRRTRVVDMTSLGLVEMTRKRVDKSLSARLTHPCHSCQGNGRRMTCEAVAQKALRDVWRRLRRGMEVPTLIRASQDVAAKLRERRADTDDIYVLAEKRPRGDYEVSRLDGPAPKDAFRIEWRQSD